MNHQKRVSFEGNDKTYLYEDILKLLAQHEKNKETDTGSSNLASQDAWTQVRNIMSTLLPSDEVDAVSNGPKMNLVNWVLLAFEDAYRLYSQETLDSDRNVVVKSPELVRILVTENMSRQEKESLELNIKKILAKSLNVTGLPKIPIYLSVSNRNIMGPPPAIHVGIDYEEVDLISHSSDGGAGRKTVRTARGTLDSTLRNTSSRTRRG